MIVLTFQKELILIKQVQQKSAIVVTIGFLNEGFKFQTCACNRCHDLLMISMNLSDITILNINGAYYCCIVSKINKK